MGNYGRFDAFVNQFDPYGTNALIQDRLRQRAYNQGMLDQRTAGPTPTQINEGLRNAQYAHDRQMEMDDEDQMRARGETDYERSLDKRGLLTTPIDTEVSGDDGRMHPATVRIRGKLSPADMALYQEAAAQGLLGGGGSTPFTNASEDRAALARLIEGKKADAIREQARTDAMALEDKRLQAAKDMRAADVAASGAASDRDFRHQEQLMRDKVDVAASDPTAQLQRELLTAQIGAQKVGLQRAQDEYLTPQQESARSQAQALALRAQTGDPEAFHALRLLTADPKLGINADVYRPDAGKVFAQPEIQQKLADIDAFIKQNNWNLSPAEQAIVVGKAKELIGAADEYGPEIAQLLRNHISQTLSGTGSLFETHGASALRAALEGL